MSRPKKFKQGEPITNITELYDWVFSGGWVYLHGRPKHPTIIQNMMLMTISAMMNGKALFKAIEAERPTEVSNDTAVE